MLLMFNAAPENRHFVLPAVAKGMKWRTLLDTAKASPKDIYPDADGPGMPTSGKITLLGRSIRCYVASREERPLAQAVRQVGWKSPGG